MKLISCTIPLLLIFLFSATLKTHAQDSSVSVDFGLGTAMDKSSNQSIDTFQDEMPFTTPKMAGTFGTFGADFMLNRHLGFGGEYSFRMAQGSYAGLNYRPIFYDFNVLYEPITESASKRVVPVIEGGLGGANLKFYYSQQFCDMFAGCSTSNSYIESSNHFQLHAAAGIRFYVKGGLFIRPQVDVHWVNHFFQFGSAWVPQYTVAIGYTLGSH